MQPNPAGLSRIEARVRHARELVQKHQFVSALAASRFLRAEVPENRDVLYLIAVCQRYLGRVVEALATLEQLEAIYPDYGRLFQERGHCYRSLGNAKAALTAYEQAVHRNHTLTASWKALSALWHSLGVIGKEGRLKWLKSLNCRGARVRRRSPKKGKFRRHDAVPIERYGAGST